MSFGRLGYYRSAEQLRRMEDRDWAALLDELLEVEDREGFAAICDLFSYWPAGPRRTEHLALSLQRLQRWDDRTRVASSSSRRLYRGDELSDVARLARHIEMYRSEDHGGPELFAIATSEHVRDLVGLSIVSSELTGNAWNAFLESPHLRDLRRLVLRNSTLGRGDISQLLRSRNLPRLRELHLVAMGVGPPTLVDARDHAPFPELEVVDLSHNVLGSEGAYLLAGAPWLTGVRRLTLRGNFIAQSGVEAVLRSPSAGTLATLDAGDNELTAQDRSALSALAAGRRIELLV